MSADPSLAQRAEEQILHLRRLTEAVPGNVLIPARTLDDSAQVIADLLSENRQIRAEREAYREALERIDRAFGLPQSEYGVEEWNVLTAARRILAENDR